MSVEWRWEIFSVANGAGRAALREVASCGRLADLLRRSLRASLVEGGEGEEWNRLVGEL